MGGDESSGFIVDAAGPDGLFGVFEDDGETGYLYIYEPDQRGIISHLHIYDRSPNTDIGALDVGVVWTGLECAVLIRGKVCGSIDAAALSG